MKKAFIIFGFVAALGITFSLNILNHIDVDKKRNSDNVIISHNPLSVNDLKNVQNIIGEKKFLTHINFSIFDLSKPSADIVENYNSKELISVLNDNLTSLFDCYVKTKCGVDESVAATLIGRNLELVKYSLKKNIELSKSVNWIVVRECSGIKNNNIRIISADLLFNFDSHNNGATKLSDIASSYSGEEKAEFYKSFSETLTHDERGVYITSLRNSFINDDFETVELLVNQMKEMHLKKEEIAELEKSLCHFKLNSKWNKIKNSMSSLSSSFEKTCL